MLFALAQPLPRHLALGHPLAARQVHQPQAAQGAAAGILPAALLPLQCPCTSLSRTPGCTPQKSDTNTHVHKFTASKILSPALPVLLEAEASLLSVSCLHTGEPFCWFKERSKVADEQAQGIPVGTRRLVACTWCSAPPLPPPPSSARPTPPALPTSASTSPGTQCLPSACCFTSSLHAPWDKGHDRG